MRCGGKKKKAGKRREEKTKEEKKNRLTENQFNNLSLITNKFPRIVSALKLS